MNSLRPYVDLTKPRITWLILMSTGVGYLFGLPAGAGWRWLTVFHTLLGTGLLASGTAALNQWWEREGDARMHRTAGRPLPSGALSASRALAFGAAISIAGFVELALAVNLLSAALGFATLASYLFLYTPLKRRSWWCTTVGAVPGAMPPVIGFAAAAGTLDARALVLFGILFLWQFPHFYAIAWMYRDDYARAGIRMLPVVKPDGATTARQMLLYATALLLLSVVPATLGMTGRLYAAAAVLLGAWLLKATIRVAGNLTLASARAVLIASVIYLPALYAAMVLDRVS